jgi:hypothetical protein
MAVLVRLAPGDERHPRAGQFARVFDAVVVDRTFVAAIGARSIPEQNFRRYRGACLGFDDAAPIATALCLVNEEMELMVARYGRTCQDGARAYSLASSTVTTLAV